MDVDFGVLDPANAVLSLRADLRFTPTEFDGQSFYLIEDPLRGKYFRIGTDEFTLISLLDGKNTVAQAAGQAAALLRERAFAENEAVSVCHWLLESQLAVCGGSAQGERLAQSARKQSASKLASYINPLVIRLPLWNPNAALCRIAPYTSWLFSGPAFIVWCIVCLVGFAVALGHGGELLRSSSVLLDRDNWLRLALVWLVLKFLHEAAHALACLRFGGTVPAVGVLLILFTPLPFVDVTASWRFPSKWQRIITAAAGMYVELFIAAAALIVWSGSDNPIVRHFTLNVAAAASVGTLLVNGNPLMRFDGYYILSDWLEMPNLSMSGQQFFARLFQRMLGIEVAPDTRPPRARRIIAVYAVAALIWRTLVYAGLLVVMYAMISRLGAILGLIAVLLAVGAMVVRPAIKVVKYLRKQPAISPRRLALLGAGALGFASLIVFLLMRPSTIRAWGIVDYSPPTIVRSGSTGFVRDVKVRDGQTVKAGQVIADLDNKELRLELADLRLQIEQSRIKERMLRQNEENAKAQAEAATRQSLEKKESEVQKLVEGLTIRAPLDGKVVARGLDDLPGRYLSVGDEVVVIGSPEKKEVILAVDQNDLRPFLAQKDRPVAVRISGDESRPLSADLTKIDPRAAQKLPHPALGADAGGNLPVKPNRNNSKSKSNESELLDPCFTATVSLTPQQSLQVHPGQRAMILFSSSEQSWAGRLLAGARKWIDDRLNSVHRNG